MNSSNIRWLFMCTTRTDSPTARTSARPSTATARISVYLRPRSTTEAREYRAPVRRAWSSWKTSWCVSRMVSETRYQSDEIECGRIVRTRWDGRKNRPVGWLGKCSTDGIFPSVIDSRWSGNFLLQHTQKSFSIKIPFFLLSRFFLFLWMSKWEKFSEIRFLVIGGVCTKIRSKNVFLQNFKRKKWKLFESFSKTFKKLLKRLKIQRTSLTYEPVDSTTQKNLLHIASHATTF